MGSRNTKNPYVKLEQGTGKDKTQINKTTFQNTSSFPKTFLNISKFTAS